jgi:hypothetical protein
MTDLVGVKRYVRLFEQIGSARARAMLDKLQIVALTSPETLRQLEAFLDRNLGLESSASPFDSRPRRDPDLCEDDDEDPTTGE